MLASLFNFKVLMINVRVIRIAFVPFLPYRFQAFLLSQALPLSCQGPIQPKMSSRGHVSDFMQGHLADLSPDDLQALLDAINMQSRLSGLRANLTTTSASLGAANNKVTKKSKSASKTSIAPGQIAKAKRPLNSWMAFRSKSIPKSLTKRGC